MRQPFVWFNDFDTELLGNLCSRCFVEIADHECPLLIFDEWTCKTHGKQVRVARFHWQCAEELIRLGVLNMTNINPNKKGGENEH